MSPPLLSPSEAQQQRSQAEKRAPVAPPLLPLLGARRRASRPRGRRLLLLLLLLPPPLLLLPRTPRPRAEAPRGSQREPQSPSSSSPAHAAVRLRIYLRDDDDGAAAAAAAGGARRGTGNLRWLAASAASSRWTRPCRCRRQGRCLSSSRSPHRRRLMPTPNPTRRRRRRRRRPLYRRLRCRSQAAVTPPGPRGASLARIPTLPKAGEGGGRSKEMGLARSGKRTDDRVTGKSPLT